MPLFDFRCEDMHWTEKFRWPLKRDLCPECETCGKPTERKIRGRRGTELADEKRAARAERHTANSMSYVVRDLHCTSEACGHVEDTVFVDRGDNGLFPSGAQCQECGEGARYEAAPELKPARSELLKAEIGGGWWDRGAGRWFNNQHDRREWMKRTGVECTEGADMMQPIQKARYEIEDLEAQHEANMAMYADHPRYRKAMAEMDTSTT